MSTLEVGQKAPSFSAKADNGKKLSLKDFKGKKLALYFYPEDDTSVCTKQACSLRDGWSELEKAGIHVVGVSKDGVESHVRFREKFGLPFPLLADTDKSVLNAYGTWGEKNMYGNIVIGTIRRTFLIDETGTIVHIIKRPKTADHAAEIAAKFERATS